MMAREHVFLVTLFIGLAAATAHATEPGQTVNGCGPDGILGRIVPNRIRIMGCELEKACNGHDICYGRCLQGGDLFGNFTCKDTEARKQRRAVCDDALYSSINVANVNRIVCRAAASVYRSFVQAYGEAYFFGIAPPKYSKEELYRAPAGHIAFEFAGRLSGSLEDRLARNFATAEAFAAYAESAHLSRTETDAALQAIATHAMEKDYTLTFRDDDAGAALVLEPVEQEVGPGHPPAEEIVVWRKNG
jgi:hypothetical protein